MQNGYLPRQEHWVVGPGAVGMLFLANFLEKKQVKTRVFSHTPELLQAAVRGPADEQHFSLQVEGLEQDNNFRSDVDQVVCYLTVHASALNLAIEGVFARLANESVRRAQIVVCSNGIVKPELTRRLLAGTNACDTSCYRALLYFGARREVVRTEAGRISRVHHTGGQQIIYGRFSTPIKDDVFLPPHWLDWFEWNEVPDIEGVECEKFFINYLLALYVGPTLRVNGTLFENVSPADYQSWLRYFSEVIYPVRRSASELDVGLRRLVTNTQQNINSLSSQWQQGQLQEISLLLSTMRDLLDRSPANAESLKFIRNKTNEQLDRFGWQGERL